MQEGCKGSSVLGVRPGFRYGEGEDRVKVLGGCSGCRICFQWNKGYQEHRGKYSGGKQRQEGGEEKVAQQRVLKYSDRVFIPVLQYQAHSRGSINV